MPWLSPTWWQKCRLAISPTTPILLCCYKAVVTSPQQVHFLLANIISMISSFLVNCIASPPWHCIITSTYLVQLFTIKPSYPNPLCEIPSWHNPIAVTAFTTTLQWSPVCHYNHPITTSISFYPPTRYKTAIETPLQIQIPLSTNNKCHSNLMEHYLWHYYKRCRFSRGFSRGPSQKCRPL